MPGSKSIAEAFVSLWGRKAINRKKRKRSNSETHTTSTIESDTLAKKRDLTGETQPISPEEDKLQATPLNDAANTQVQNRHHEPLGPSSDNAETAHALDLTKLVQDLHFYLHRPNTLSSVKCLIPLSPFSPIHDVLQDRTILEFPTFHVRDESPEQLSSPYITEEKYNEMYGSEVPIDLPTYASKDIPVSEADALAAIDENKVLEVLKKDLMN
jgi:hypothetical protein